MTVNEKAVALARARDDTPSKTPTAPAPGTRDVRRPTVALPADVARNHWAVQAAEGVATTDVASARFFSHLQPKLRPGDRIELTAHDGSWMLDLRVMASEAGAVRTFVMNRYDFGDTVASRATIVADGYTIQYGSEQTKWRIIRAEDKAVLKEGFPDQKAAAAWLNGHLVRMGEASIT